MKKIILFLLLLIGVSINFSYGQSKTWTGFADDFFWHQAENWSPSSVPALTNEVTIDSGVDVKIDQTFEVGSITLGGSSRSSLISQNFIYGTISPASSSDSAVLVRKEGHLILKGPGVITLEGSYFDSEEELDSQPSFLFWVE